LTAAKRHHLAEHYDVMSADLILSVIEAIYDAALDETQWTKALAALTAVTSSQAATFWVLDSSAQPRLPTLITFNFEPVFIAEYLNGMVPLDPTVQYLVAHPDEPIVHDGLVITEREKDRHAYYDWHGGHSDTRYRMVGQACPAQKVQAGVALHRTRSVGRFEPADIRQFAVLRGHLARALAIAYRLGTLGTLQQCTTELLDRHAAAIMLLDDRRRVVYLNRHAADVNARGDGVTLLGNRLRLTDTREDARLQALIARAISRDRAGAASGGAMRAHRPSGKHPYGIFVTPVSRDYAVLTSVRPVVCVMIREADRGRLLTTRLRAMFDLTDAEARLADRLTAGDDLRAAASTLGITYGTARTRLAEIFQKTNTHRQSELVSLLLSVAAAD